MVVPFVRRNNNSLTMYLAVCEYFTTKLLKNFMGIINLYTFQELGDKVLAQIQVEYKRKRFYPIL